AMENPAFRDYAGRMEAACGADRAREILSVGRWNSNIYPSLSFMSQFRQLRVVHPVSVDRTEVFGFCFRLKGAPDSMFEDTIRFANVTNATASPVLTDDLETYFRIRRGLTTQGSDWVPTARALGTDRPDGHGGWEAADGTSELHIRNMMQAWAGYMADASA
ncbi:MAG: ribosomal subunit interface protein, partial [Alphaproteobacteria bacterium]|nr:ribosomal subunit interface protein [Alphaproteobacteria bacterium]